MTSINRITIHPDVFELAPRYRRVVLLAEVDDVVASEALAIAFSESQGVARAAVDLAAGDLSAIPAIAAWRAAFGAAGIPTKNLPAMEALLRRTVDAPLRPITPLVDAGTAVSLTYLAPVGVHVIDGLDGALELRPSPGGETMETLNGQIERTKPGELVWACGSTVLTRRWAWRQGRIGSVAPDSKHLAVNIDLIDGVDDGVVAAMTELLESCGATVTDTVTLDVDSPSATVGGGGEADGLVVENELLQELLDRGLIADCTNLAGLDARMGEGRITFYVGIDPSAASLHVGSLLVLSVVRRFQRAGHQPIIIVGGATGFIGDPSGKSTDRNLLSVAELDANKAALEVQLRSLLGPVPGGRCSIVVDNRDWLGAMDCLEFLREVGSQFRVGEMLAKDSVRTRLSGAGMSFTEFSYSLLQAEDFANLNRRLGCILQLGGSDQWGNIVSGIDLIRRREQGDAFGLVWPLLTRADGEKFGKSAGENVWLDATQTSPWQFWQFWLNTADADVEGLLLRFSVLPVGEIGDLVARHQVNPERRIAQRALADELTTWVHGAEVLPLLHKMSTLMFGAEVIDLGDADVRELLESELPTVHLDEVVDLDVAALTVASGIATSRSDASRLIESGALRINGSRPADPRDSVIPDHGGAFLLQRGRRTHHLVLVDADQVSEER